MKRFHVHLSVADLDANIQFYSNLFGAPPTAVKPDYAKWMLDEPRVNFAISNRQTESGLNHLGLQTDDAAELNDIRQQMDTAATTSGSDRRDEANTGCCYAVSNKHWVLDPQGIAWEGFQTLGDIPVYHDQQPSASEPACCIPLAPSTEKSTGCCVPSSKATSSGSSCCG